MPYYHLPRCTASRHRPWRTYVCIPWYWKTQLRSSRTVTPEPGSGIWARDRLSRRTTLPRMLGSSRELHSPEALAAVPNSPPAPPLWTPGFSSKRLRASGPRRQRPGIARGRIPTPGCCPPKQRWSLSLLRTAGEAWCPEPPRSWRGERRRVGGMREGGPGPREDAAPGRGAQAREARAGSL